MKTIKNFITKIVKSMDLASILKMSREIQEYYKKAIGIEEEIEL